MPRQYMRMVNANILIFCFFFSQVLNLKSLRPGNILIRALSGHVNYSIIFTKQNLQRDNNKQKI